MRRRLLRACRERPRPAMELAGVVGEPAATVSEHLKVLRKTRLVVLRAEGRYRMYRADPRIVEVVREALARLGSG